MEVVQAIVTAMAKNQEVLESLKLKNEVLKAKIKE